jgi:hypothetical protein
MSGTEVSNQHVVSVFRRPAARPLLGVRSGKEHDVHGQSRDRVASGAAASHTQTLTVAFGPTHRLKDLH